MTRYLMALLAMCLVAGCTHTVDVTKTAKGFHAATNPNDIEILMTKPDKKFTELGTLSTSGWDARDTAKMYNALRAKAAPLGADAVIVLNSGLVKDSQWATPYMWVTAVAVQYEPQ